MSGKEIRAWARKEIKEQRRFLVLNCLISFIPGALWLGLSYLARWQGWTLPIFVSWPFSLTSRFLNLCFLALVLTLVKTGKRRKLLDPVREGKGTKMLLIVFFMWGLTTLVSAGPNLLVRKGQEMMAAAPAPNPAQYLLGENSGLYLRGQNLKNIGSSLNTWLSLLCSFILFPVGYMLFLKPEKSVKQVILEGTGIGFGNLWTILSFLIVLILPFIGCLFAVCFPSLFVLFALTHSQEFFPHGLTLCVVVMVGLMLWYAPRFSLAQARFALELIGRKNIKKGAARKGPRKGK